MIRLPSERKSSSLRLSNFFRKTWLSPTLLENLVRWWIATVLLRLRIIPVLSTRRRSTSSKNKTRSLRTKLKLLNNSNAELFTEVSLRLILAFLSMNPRISLMSRSLNSRRRNLLRASLLVSLSKIRKFLTRPRKLRMRRRKKPSKEHQRLKSLKLKLRMKFQRLVRLLKLVPIWQSQLMRLPWSFRESMTRSSNRPEKNSPWRKIRSRK